ncbi:MAG: EutN/CcmL family microcompartment protein [Oligoflexia bacterium]|nr:EutN/CcmL family microcompartment protein [Oligoflexia bacterium]
MRFARVVGTVVATIKDPKLHGEKLLLIQPLDDKLKESGDIIAAIDVVSAGPGDIVYYTLSREAAFALKSVPPVDAAITGFVDTVNIEWEKVDEDLRKKVFENN